MNHSLASRLITSTSSGKLQLEFDYVFIPLLFALFACHQLTAGRLFPFKLPQPGAKIIVPDMKMMGFCDRFVAAVG